MPQLRPQVAACQDRARFVNFEPVALAKRYGNACGFREVRLHMPGERTLRGLNQPSRVTHEPDCVSSPAPRVQQVEKALDMLQALSRLVVVGRWTIAVPDPQAQALELTEDERRVQALRVDDAAVPAWPAVRLPMMMRAKDKLHRVERTRVAVLMRRLEPVGEMGGLQLPGQPGEMSWDCGRFEKAIVEHVADRFAIAVPRVRLAPGAE
jgi:hypothetical protein